MKHIKSITLAAVILLGVTFEAWGASCTVSSGTLNFGGYNMLSGSPLDANGTISVNCTLSAPYTVSLDAGINGAGNPNNRKLRLSATAYYLSYNLYRETGRSTVWGDGTSGTYTQAGTGTGALQNLTVYGRIPAGASVPSGVYNDTITVTVTY
ncbi:MAG: spore coat protein U domain-containing protein [Deltaproteobacteria bacterium]|nr:spore coat protein U domain-containing protein [Deltaproteobacteria bacterium]